MKSGFVTGIKRKALSNIKKLSPQNNFIYRPPFSNIYNDIYLERPPVYGKNDKIRANKSTTTFKTFSKEVLNMSGPNCRSVGGGA